MATTRDGRRSRPLAEKTSEPKGRRSSEPKPFIIVLTVLLAYVCITTISLGIGATVQLWNSPGNSLAWEVFFPVVTIGGLVAAITIYRRSRQRGSTPTAAFLLAELTLCVSTVLLLAAFVAAPN
ncbi:MAG: hypothetical protein WCL38_04765 [Actinomycetota bacterium]